MKESVGYYATLNIIITFIVIIFTFLSFALIYYKANKVTNVITNSIEKYEGYNNLSENEIAKKLNDIGYGKVDISNNCSNKPQIKSGNTVCNLLTNVSGILYSDGKLGYCVYECIEDDYYYYKVRTNMLLNIPIIHNLLDIPIYSNTNRMYDFEK